VRAPDPTVHEAAASRADLHLAVAAEVLRPLVGMLLDNGARYGAIAELLKALLVERALAQVPGAAGPRGISRISAATGIHRKEVKRLMTLPGRVSEQLGRSLAAEVFTRWCTDRRFLDANGRPRALARGAAGDDTVSFETLARAVSRDVHPRTILEELLRLGIAESGPDGCVRLVVEAFVPAAEQREMLGFLAANVSDHLAAAVTNVQGGAERFLEQALYADALSPSSAQRIDALAREHWRRLLCELAPQLQALVDADREAGAPADRRVRVGMYAYSAPMAPPTVAPGMPPSSPSAPAPSPSSPSATPTRRRRRRMPTAGAG